MALYNLQGVKCLRGSRVILDIEELAIEAGKVYSLTGPNGAGKTTLLNLLAFLDSPDQGIITFSSQQITGSDSRYLARQRVVLVDQ